MTSLTESFSSKIAYSLCESKDKSSDDYQVLKYGVFVFLHVSLAAIFTIIFGILTNTVYEIVVISLMSGLMKRNSGGVHCSSANRCTITGIIVSYIFCIIGKLLLNIKYPALYLIIIAILIHAFIILYKKCPVPSENKPLKKEATRNKLRRNAFSIYFICVLIFGYNLLNLKFNSLILFIILGLYMQTLSLTIIGSEFILFIDRALLKFKI